MDNLKIILNNIDSRLIYVSKENKILWENTSKVFLDSFSEGDFCFQKKIFCFHDGRTEYKCATCAI